MYQHCICETGHRTNANRSKRNDVGSDAGSPYVIFDLNLQLLLHHLHHGHLPQVQVQPQ